MWCSSCSHRIPQGWSSDSDAALHVLITQRGIFPATEDSRPLLFSEGSYPMTGFHWKSMVVINNQVLFFQYLVLTALGEGYLSGQSVGTAAHSNYCANATGNIFDLQCPRAYLS